MSWIDLWESCYVSTYLTQECIWVMLPLRDTFKTHFYCTFLQFGLEWQVSGDALFCIFLPAGKEDKIFQIFLQPSYFLLNRRQTCKFVISGKHWVIVLEICQRRVSFQCSQNILFRLKFFKFSNIFDFTYTVADFCFIVNYPTTGVLLFTLGLNWGIVLIKKMKWLS